MYTLRVQLLLSFGVPTLLTIALVVSLAISFAHIAGKEVRVRANDVLEDQVIGSFARSSDLIAERVAAYMDNANGALQLMVEITRDRIVGYPEVGWEDDIYVPFFDTDTQRNMYPLKTPIPPLDWDITLDSDTMGDVYAPSVNYENVNKFFQDASVTGGGGISTSSGVYHFQGSCDPNEDDPTARGYAPNCTLAHNNLRTGGAVQPTNLSFFLQQKSGDIATLIRPIYEAQEDVMIAAIHFINSGAGATLWYPGHRVASGSYTSRGCEWMRQTNPYAGKPYGTEQDIDRCHPEGTIVSTREYNALERAWFHDCIENHEEFRWHGPFPAFDSGVELLTICRAIYDRK